MSWNFNSSTADYVVLSDNAALTLPSGDWTIAGWLNSNSLSGTESQQIIAWGTYDTNNSIAWWYQETSHATQANKISFNIKDGSGNGTGDIHSSSTQITSAGTWYHVLLERSNTSFNCYVNGASASTTSVGSVGAINSSLDLYLGSDNPNLSQFSMEGPFAEFAKWDRALSSSEKASLVKGFSPMFFSNSITWYVPMIRAYVEIKVPLVVTNGGTSVSSHLPTVVYPYSHGAGYGLLNIIKTFSDSGAAGSESFSKVVSVIKSFSDAGASGSSVWTSGIQRTKTFSDSGASGSSSWNKTTYVPLDDALEVFSVEVYDD